MKPYTEGLSYPTVVDVENKLGNYFDFDIIPNGIFLDETGTIKMVKQGFHVTKEEHLAVLEDLIAGKVETAVLDDVYYEPNEKSELERKLSKTKFALGLEYLKQGKKETALIELDEALRYNPDNFLIRKQLWYIRYPEKFSPTIDIDWQQVQLKKEKLAEADDRGPDGCKIPGTK
ncbi:thioredoxin family protein [Bacillaceae bacterium IKA-2]|nr:thioredoxin family protein [Bacillaceae bacterium IKA-2]